MAEAAAGRFVTQDAFDIQVKSIRERASSDEKLADIRFDYMREVMTEQTGRLAAIVEKNLAKHEAIASDIKGEMRAMNERIEKNLAQYEAIASDIKGDVKALGARLDTQQNKFAWNIAWVGIVMGLVLAIVQHIWK